MLTVEKVEPQKRWVFGVPSLGGRPSLSRTFNVTLSCDKTEEYEHLVNTHIDSFGCRSTVEKGKEYEVTILQKGFFSASKLQKGDSFSLEEFKNISAVHSSTIPAKCLTKEEEDALFARYRAQSKETPEYAAFLEELESLGLMAPLKAAGFSPNP